MQQAALLASQTAQNKKRYLIESKSGRRFMVEWAEPRPPKPEDFERIAAESEKALAADEKKPAKAAPGLFGFTRDIADAVRAKEAIDNPKHRPVTTAKRVPPRKSELDGLKDIVSGVAGKASDIAGSVAQGDFIPAALAAFDAVRGVPPPQRVASEAAPAMLKGASQATNALIGEGTRGATNAIGRKVVGQDWQDVTAGSEIGQRQERIVQNAVYALPFVGGVKGAIDMAGLGAEFADGNGPEALKQFVGGIAQSANAFEEGIDPEERVARVFNAAMLAVGLTHGGIKAYKAGNTALAAKELARVLKTDEAGARGFLKNVETYAKAYGTVAEGERFAARNELGPQSRTTYTDNYESLKADLPTTPNGPGVGQKTPRKRKPYQWTPPQGIDTPRLPGEQDTIDIRAGLQPEPIPDGPSVGGKTPKHRAKKRPQAEPQAAPAAEAQTPAPATPDPAMVLPDPVVATPSYKPKRRPAPNPDAQPAPVLPDAAQDAGVAAPVAIDGAATPTVAAEVQASFDAPNTDAMPEQAVVDLQQAQGPDVPAQGGSQGPRGQIEAAQNEELRRMGFDVDNADKTTVKDILDRADQISADDADALVAVAANKANRRQFTDAETARIGRRVNEHMQAANAADAEYSAAIERGDQAAAAVALEKGRIADESAAAAMEAIRNAGSEWGKAGVSRQIELLKDNSEAGLLRRGTRKKEGRLAADEVAELRRKAAEYDELKKAYDKALADREAGMKAADTPEAVAKELDRQRRAAEARKKNAAEIRKARGKAKIEATRKEIDAAVRQLFGQASLGIDPTKAGPLFKLYGRQIANYISYGGMTLQEAVRTFRIEQKLENDLDLDEKDLTKAFLDRNKPDGKTQKAKSSAQKALAEAEKEARLLDAIDRELGNASDGPKPVSEVPTERIQELRDQLAEIRKGKKAKDAETKALDRLQKKLDDVLAGRKAQKAKEAPASTDSPEVADLKRQIAEARKAKAEEKAKADEVARLEKRLADIEAGVQPERRTPTEPKSPEAKDLRDRIEAAKKAKAEVKAREAEIRLLEQKLADLEAGKAPQPKTKAAPKSKEAADLRAKIEAVRRSKADAKAKADEIARLQKRLADIEAGTAPEKRGEPQSKTKEAADLRAKIEEAKAAKAKAAAEARLLQRLQEKLDALEAGTWEPTQGEPRQYSPEAQALRDQIAEAQKGRAESKDKADRLANLQARLDDALAGRKRPSRPRGEPTPEEASLLGQIRIEEWRNRIRSRIAEYKRQIDAADFPEPKPRKMPTELEAIAAEERRWRAERDAYMASLAPKTVFGKGETVLSSIQLFSVPARVLDLTGNITKFLSRGATSGARLGIGYATSKATGTPMVEKLMTADKWRFVSRGFWGATGERFSAQIKGMDPDKVAKYGRGSIIHNLSGVTDVPFNEYYYRSFAYDLADYKARVTLGSGADKAAVKSMRDGILNDLESHPDVMLAAEELALRETFNIDNVVSKTLSRFRGVVKDSAAASEGAGGSGNPRMRGQGAADATMLIMNQFGGRFSKVVGNVALEKANYVPSLGTAEGGARLGRLVVHRLQGKTLDPREIKRVNDLFTKGAVGLATMQLGAAAYNSGVEIGRYDEKGRYFDFGDLGQLNGLISPFLIGYAFAKIDAMDLSDETKSAIKWNTSVGVTLDQPMVSLGKNIIKSGDSPDRAKRLLMNSGINAFIPGGVRDLARRQDAYEQTGTIIDTGKAREREAETPQELLASKVPSTALFDGRLSLEMKDGSKKKSKAKSPISKAPSGKPGR